MQQNYSNLKEAWNICFEGSEFPLWVQMGESKSLTSLLWGWSLGQNWALPECRHLKFPQKVPSLWSDSAWFLSRVRISNLLHMQCYILLIKNNTRTHMQDIYLPWVNHFLFLVHFYPKWPLKQPKNTLPVTSLVPKCKTQVLLCLKGCWQNWLMFRLLWL